MKLLTLGVAVVCQISAFAALAMCQEKKPQPERLHLTNHSLKLVRAASS